MSDTTRSTSEGVLGTRRVFNKNHLFPDLPKSTPIKRVEFRDHIAMNSFLRSTSCRVFPHSKHKDTFVVIPGKEEALKADMEIYHSKKASYTDLIRRFKLEATSLGLPFPEEKLLEFKVVCPDKSPEYVRKVVKWRYFVYIPEV